MTTKRYLTAKEAAAALGITLPTLYAYVSRGLIRSEPGEGKTRARRYRQEDVAALQSRREWRRSPAKAVASALHWGAPLLESAITLIEDGRLYYRGHDVLTLPQKRSFEEVARLLWQGEFAPFTERLSPAQQQLVQETAPVTAGLSPAEAFQAVLPLAGARDLAGYDLRDTAVALTGERILWLMTAVVAVNSGQWSVVSDQYSVFSERGIAGCLQAIWAAERPETADLFNAALIYCADHELNVSAFAARVGASAQATPYQVVAAGLAALQGRLHGGATGQAVAFLREVGAPERARQVIGERLKRGERIPGFGHPLYPDGDPRGRALLERVTAVLPDAPGTLLAQAVAQGMAGTVGLQPNVDFALTALAWALELPPGAPLALFALGRAAGWMGQAIEQYRSGQLIRPRARYVGARPDEEMRD